MRYYWYCKLYTLDHISLSYLGHRCRIWMNMIEFHNVLLLFLLSTVLRVKRCWSTGHGPMDQWMREVLENQSADIEAAENFSVFAKPVVGQKGELEGFIYRLQKGWKAQAQHYLMMFLFIVHLTKSVMMLPLNPQPFRKRWNMLKHAETTSQWHLHSSTKKPAVVLLFLRILGNPWISSCYDISSYSC